MDVALLLILPLVGGYAFARNWEPSRNYLAREEGHRLYFRSAFYAIALFFAAGLLRLWWHSDFEWYRHIESLLFSLFDPFLKHPHSQHESIVTLIAIYSLVLGILAPWPINTVLPNRRFLERAIADNDFEKLLHRALREFKLLSITMQSRKVYVGWATGTFDPTLERRTLAIYPAMSGYRDEITGEVYFTTNYREARKEAMEGRQLSHLDQRDFIVVLPTDRMESVSIFDPAAYALFQQSANNSNQSNTQAAKSSETLDG